MRCPACQHACNTSAWLCAACGASLIGVCRACGASNTTDGRFCNQCGHRLNLPEAERVLRTAAERRQLTVMFCDLVDSTALSARLDPEDLRDVVQAYQETCGAVIRRYGGHLASYLGDGLLVYFGYPVAHENDPERSVRVGLGIIEEMGGLNARFGGEGDIRLAARIGIHTGLVVAGEMGTEEHRDALAIVGETPNVAARLQGIAPPNAVVVSDATLRLIPGLFVSEDLGRYVLKGLSEPMAVHRVVEAREPRSRLEVAARLTPLVGREQDLALLLERWDRVRGGHGQTVLVCGEAGIGKSRLVQALRDGLASEPHIWLECRASPYHETSAFYPVIRLLRQVLELPSEAPAAEQIERLERGLALAGFALPEVMPLLAALLSIPCSDAPPALSPEAQRREVLETLSRWLCSLAKQRPVVLVVEDLHWIDPSTLELLGMLIQQVHAAPVLLVPTFRPAFEPPWSAGPSATRLTVNPLTRPQVATMIESLTVGHTLPVAIVERVAEKTDGVPLFVEELTKSILESGQLSGGSKPDDLAIPATLQDSLMARLDRMGPAKETAQLAAVLGREFSYELIEAVSGSTAALRSSLARLTEAELLYERGTPAGVIYTFKHALIREAAYRSLLKRARQECHARIATVLETRFGDVVNGQHEVLARHHEEAANAEQAIAYWHRAGELATKRAAHVEAITHLTRGIDLVRTLKEGEGRNRREALLCVALGVPLQAVRGYADAEVERCYRRARELCDDRETALGFRALWGLFQLYNSRAEFETASEIAAQLLALATKACEPSLALLSHAVSGVAHFWRGEPAAALRDAEETLAVYEPAAHGALSHLYGQNPGVAARVYGGCALAQLGFPDQGLAWIQAALAQAHECENPFDRAFALTFSAIFHIILGQRELTRCRAEEGLAVSAARGFPLWLGVARMLRAWALVEDPGDREPAREIRRGIMQQGATGNQAGGPIGMGLLADAYLKAGDVPRAREAVDAGLALAAHSSSHVWDAELHRLRGEIHLREDPPSKAAAERCFEEACDAARNRGMKTSELRSMVSLARLRAERGKRREARAALALLYGWFTEGFSTPALLEAKALLEGLSFGEVASHA
jgi:class 3 adenylate cyclase/predicted ATPase